MALARRSMMEGGMHELQGACWKWCSKGTYVRSLVYDVGRALGTVAFMASLRRDAIGDFHVQDAWQLQDLISHLRKARDQAQEVEQQDEH
eukprot:1144004-Pelagomonas_calceolata.AAC.2